MRRKCICMIIFAMACLGMAGAQSTQDMQAEDPTKKCEPQQDISSLASAALAQEWLDSNAVDYMMLALRLHIEGGQRNVDYALGALVKAAPANEDLYRASYGVPDPYGQPTAQGVSAFLEILAKANTLCTANMTGTDTDTLFKGVEKLIDAIYTSNGKQAVVNINSLFAQGDSYRALFELLKARCSRHGKDLTHDLESLRAAYEANTPRLAKLVLDELTKTKKMTGRT